jgi:hypothetical protein
VQIAEIVSSRQRQQAVISKRRHDAIFVVFPPPE